MNSFSQLITAYTAWKFIKRADKIVEDGLKLYSVSDLRKVTQDYLGKDRKRLTIPFVREVAAKQYRESLKRLPYQVDQNWVTNKEFYLEQKAAGLLVDREVSELRGQWVTSVTSESVGRGKLFEEYWSSRPYSDDIGFSPKTFLVTNFYSSSGIVTDSEGDNEASISSCRLATPSEIEEALQKLEEIKEIERKMNTLQRRVVSYQRKLQKLK